MSQRSHGLFSGRSRHLARHNKPSSLGIPSLVKRLDLGNMVVITPKGNFRDIPHPRYRGRIGKIVEKRGSAYVVEFDVSKSMKRQVIVPQRHLELAR